MLEASPDLASRIAGLYDHVLVDEYQDTNLLQARILRGMCAGHRKLTVVGDDAQSIYSFRGAHFRNILDFPQAVPRRDARHARPELPLHRADPRPLQHADLARRGTVHQGPVDDPARAARSPGSSRRRTRRSRRASSSTVCCSCTRAACRSARWRCSSAPATCRPISRSS